ncbi:MAG: repeat-containing protein [Rickettsiaceae bacterium]|jgi:tetratricopeptide (TPR) repeat protein|nr:repeat-containing protein [Rickettsiaceae bacterium]
MDKIYLQYGNHIITDANVNPGMDSLHLARSMVETIRQKVAKDEWTDDGKDSFVTNNSRNKNAPEMKASVTEELLHLSATIAIFQKLNNITVEDKDAYAIVLQRRGYIHSFLEMYDLAMEDANKAIELSPDNAFNYRIRATVYSRLKNVTDAIKDMETCCSMKGAYINARDCYDLGDLYFAAEQFDKSLSCYKRAMQLPDGEIALANFLAANTYLKLNDYDNAIAEYTNGIYKTNRSIKDVYKYTDVVGFYYCRANSHKLRGIELLEQGKENQAREYFCRAWLDYGTIAEIYPNLHNAMLELEKYGTNEKTVEEFKQNDVYYTKRAYELGQADQYYYEALATEKSKSRIQLLNKAIDIFMKFPPLNLAEVRKYAHAYNLRGLCYLEGNSPHNALEDLFIAKTYFPEEPKYVEDYDKATHQ